MKTKTFTLKILKKDLLTADYVDPKNCAIARSIKRMGGYFDGIRGGGVCYIDADFYYKGETFKIEGEKYRNFCDRIHSMMRKDKKAKAFSIKLTATIQ